MTATYKCALVFLMSLVTVFVLFISHEWHCFLATPLMAQSSKSEQEKTVIIIPSGIGAHQMADLLVAQGALKNPWLLTVFTYVRGDTRRLKAGEYLLTNKMTPVEFINNVVNGKVIQHTITFIEGWTFGKVRRVLMKNKYIRHTLNRKNIPRFMHSLGLKERYSEGLFFPDTYQFAAGIADRVILRQAYKKMQRVMQYEWRNRAFHLHYKNWYQALIIASLVEKETAVPRERSQIAGVILHRLYRRMRLQVDPTVAYGLHYFSHQPLTHQDLLRRTPYNTYVHYGLPPSPIAIPSRASIHAALHPTIGKSLYYLSKGDGTHIFSNTYVQHRRALHKYILHNAFKSFVHNPKKVWHHGVRHHM